MKKSLFILFVMLFAVTSAFSQSNFKIGVNAGIPVGDVEDITTFQLGLDVAYLYPVSDLFSVGGLVGYSRYFGDDINTSFGTVSVDDFSFLPIAASARFGFENSLFVGADLGYAVGLDDGNDGGFYYRPKVGYSFGPVAVIASFAGIAVDGGDVSSVNLGVEFGF
ncbi:MAG: hypothetical protein R6W85_13510 [Gillisia sp.]